MQLIKENLECPSCGVENDFDKYEPHFWLVVPAASNIQDLLKATTANAA